MPDTTTSRGAKDFSHALGETHERFLAVSRSWAVLHGIY